MISINTSGSQFVARRALDMSQKRANTALERLSTGLRINRGKDDPSGLVASETFRARAAAIEQGIANGNRAGAMMSTADAALTEVGSLLTELESLVSASANSGALTSEEREASQLQVDGILSQIQRVASTTEFNGKKLLDGSLGYRTTGVTATALQNVQVNSAKVPAGSTKTMNIAVQTAATRARTDYTGGTLAAGNNVTLEVTGNTGTSQISFAAGSTVAQMATVVNSLTGETGVQATVVGANLQFESASFGSQQNTSVKVLSGTYATTLVGATGTDAVVRVNGALAGANGTSINYRDASTDASFDLTATSNVAGQATSFNITGGGADFIVGPKVADANRFSIGLQSVSTTSLGNSTVGFLSTLRSGEANSLLGTNLAQAQKISDAALKQVSMLRGRIGGFEKYSVDATIAGLDAQLESVTVAGGQIRDADYARETAELSRQQILQQAATSAFASASRQPQIALSLLSTIQ
jgi:flagellin